MTTNPKVTVNLTLGIHRKYAGHESKVTDTVLQGFPVAQQRSNGNDRPNKLAKSTVDSSEIQANDFEGQGSR